MVCIHDIIEHYKNSLDKSGIADKRYRSKKSLEGDQRVIGTQPTLMRPPPTAMISNVQKHVRKNAPSWLESQLTAVLELHKEFH